MTTTNTTLRVFPVLAVVVLLAACEAQVTLETAPQALAEAGNPRDECRNRPYWKADDWSDDGWGGAIDSSDPPGDGAITLDDSGYKPTVTYTVNTDLTLVAVYAKAGTDLFEMGTSGSFTWPDDNRDISHVTFCFEDGEDTTTTAAGDTTTSAALDTTSSAGDTTTTEGGGDTTTTIDGETTITQGGDSTTTAGGETTTTAGGDTTTTAGGDVTTTTIGGVTVTSEPGANTTSGDGPPVTEGGGAEGPTTTAEVGAGGLTTTPDGGGEGESEGTLDPTQETSTTGDEVGGVSDETLPRTGAGQMSLSGLAGLLLGAGAILLLLIRRRSRED